MPRDTSPYVVGGYWLDKRRDGKSPDVWQIATYDGRSRQVVYRSTRRRSLDDAVGALLAHVEAERAKRPQAADALKLVPSLFVYWEEHGRKTKAAYAVALSIRVFLGFLLQDEAGVELTIADTTPALWRRFREWRMQPHAFEVVWGGKTYRTDSKGVSGETVATNLGHIRAAINHQVNEGRIPYAPRVPQPPREFRSPPRDLLFSIDEMGAIMAASSYNIDLHRWLVLQIATCIRPVAGLRLRPDLQYDREHGLLDLHPVGDARTKKRNPIVPVIDEFSPKLAAWADEVRASAADPKWQWQPAGSRKTAWRILRRVLQLDPRSEPKTIRHSIATQLRGMSVPALEIEGLLGHTAMKGVTARYAKYDPAYLVNAKAALATIYSRIMSSAERWAAVHLLAMVGRGEMIVVDRESQEAQISAAANGAAYRTRTCDPRITNARKGWITANRSAGRRERSDDA